MEPRSRRCPASQETSSRWRASAKDSKREWQHGCGVGDPGRRLAAPKVVSGSLPSAAVRTIVFDQGQCCAGNSQHGNYGQPSRMRFSPELRAVRMCTFIEFTVSSEIARQGFPEVVGPRRIFRPVVLLRVVPGTSKITIRKGGKQLVADNGFHRRPPGVILAAMRMMGCVVDGPGCYFRLKDWRNRLRLAGQAALHPSKLRSVKRGHLHH